MDVAQAFDKVWHKGLIYELSKMFSTQYVEILTSYISNRLFRIKQEDEYSDLKEIRAGVSQGSVVGPTLYLLYTSDLPVLEDTAVATFADDTALYTVNHDQGNTIQKLQTSSNKIVN